MALALSGPRSPREKASVRSVVAAARRAGEDGEADLGLALLHFATSRSWWIDPGRRGPIGNRRCSACARPGQARRPPNPHERDRAEDHIDELLAYLVKRSGSPEPATGIDLRRLATAALWVGALDLAADTSPRRTRHSAMKAASDSSPGP